MPCDLETPNHTQFSKPDLLLQAFRNLFLCLKCAFLTIPDPWQACSFPLTLYLSAKSLQMTGAVIFFIFQWWDWSSERDCTLSLPLHYLCPFNICTAPYFLLLPLLLPWISFFLTLTHGSPGHPSKPRDMPHPRETLPTEPLQHSPGLLCKPLQATIVS